MGCVYIHWNTPGGKPSKRARRMVKFFFHCVWSLEQRAFVVTIEKTKYLLSPAQMKTMLDKADAQVANVATDTATVDLDLGDNRGYKFTGLPHKTMLEYLHKVYDGWDHFTFADDGQNKGRHKP